MIEFTKELDDMTDDEIDELAGAIAVVIIPVGVDGAFVAAIIGALP